MLYPQKNSSPVHGVWVTNVDSDFLLSKENIIKNVALCDSLGINTIFMVVWNKGMTLYPSATMKQMFGEDIDPALAGRDPLKEVIEQAHKRNIKVFAWFEFGFSSSYMLDGGRLLKLHPEWAALNNSKKLVQKNGFEWMNGINPEVQDFMLSLISEVVQNYEVDGIQGDDRLPALPVEAGYDSVTAKLYQLEHQGKMPPADYRDKAWMQWRSDKLNEFMKRIYKTVKAIKSECIVSMAPSLYPWAKDEYLQDWPTWLKDGWVDMVCPQLYRYKAHEYIAVLDEAVKYQVSKENLKRFFPGILIKLGKYQPTLDYMKTVIKANRNRGIHGEVFFFFEGIKKYPEFFRDTYKNNKGHL